MVARYIDLNPVRAGLVVDPAKYEWSGYGEAMRGNERSRKGIIALLGMRTWEEADVLYRVGMYLKAGESGHSKKVALEREEILKELKKGGQLEMAQLLRMRVRYFSDGVALGQKEFLEGVFQKFRGNFGEKRKTGARTMKKFPATHLKTLRDLRVKAVE